MKWASIIAITPDAADPPMYSAVTFVAAIFSAIGASESTVSRHLEKIVVIRSVVNCAYRSAITRRFHGRVPAARESSAGVEVGGRTGWTSVFTALCFLPCLFLAPVAGMVPAYATAPVLILVGALMFRSVAKLPMEKLEDVIPAFLTIILIPLTFSITQGILWGFMSHVGLYLMAGRRKEIHPMMFGLAAISIGLLALEYGAWG